MNKPAKEPKPKLSPEERAAHRREALAKAREAKKTKKAQMEALMEKLAQSGKSIEEPYGGAGPIKREKTNAPAPRPGRGAGIRKSALRP